MSSSKRSLGLFALALAVALSPGCRCASLTKSAHEERVVLGHRVNLKARGFHEIGVGAIGAAHAIGIIYPTIEGKGFTVDLGVDDRETATIHVQGTGDTMYSDEQLADELAHWEVAGSPDGDHLSYRRSGGEPADWRLAHLLPKGPPFDSPNAVSVKADSADAIDFSTMKRSEALALELLSDCKKAHHEKNSALWEAVEELPFGEPWDSAILDAWPHAKPAGALLEDRIENGTKASREFQKKAVDTLLAKIPKKESMRATVEMLEHTQDPEVYGRMDDALVDVWPATHESHKLLVERLETSDSPRHPAVKPETRKRAEEKARPALRGGQWWDAAELLLTLHTEEGEAAALETLLEHWPDKSAHRLLKGNTQHASADWKKRADEKAKKALTSPEEQHQEAGTDLLLVLGPESEKAAVEAAAQRWPKTTPHVTAVLQARTAKLDAKSRASLVERAKAMEASPPKELDAYRSKTVSNAMLFWLEYETGDCKLLDAYGRAGQVSTQLPERCRHSP